MDLICVSSRKFLTRLSVLFHLKIYIFVLLLCVACCVSFVSLCRLSGADEELIHTQMTQKKMLQALVYASTQVNLVSFVGRRRGCLRFGFTYDHWFPRLFQNKNFAAQYKYLRHSISWQRSTGVRL